MFNKKLKQENRMLRLDNNDLSQELDRVNEELDTEHKLRINTELQVSALEALINAQGVLIGAFAEHIVKNDKKLKTKKGKKNGKKAK